MTEPGPSEPPFSAVLFDLDDVLVPFHTVRAWQWAWHPQGPLLGERHAQTALRRSLHDWDRRRWRGVTGAEPAPDLAQLREHLAATLRALARHDLPPEESEAVVRRLLHPAGDVERFDDVAPALGRLERAGVRVGVLTPLPVESARWLLHRVGLSEELVVAAGDGPGPVVPAREAFRSAVDRLDGRLSRTAFVGDLYWSDVRAARRAGLAGLLLDRRESWPHVQEGRLTSLAGLDEALVVAARRPAEAAGAPEGPSDALS